MVISQGRWAVLVLAASKALESKGILDSPSFGYCVSPKLDVNLGMDI